jgi:signal transduction histidine kinase
MGKPRKTSNRVVNYFPRALGVVLAGGAIHLALAHLMLGPLAGPDTEWLQHGPRLTLSLVVAATFVAQLIGFYMRAAHSSPEQVTITVPFLARLVPPIAAAGLVPLLYEAFLLEDATTIFRSALPVVVASWSTGLIVGLVEKRVLHALGLRVRPETLGNILRNVETVGLAGSFARVLAGAATVGSLLAFGAILTSLEDPIAYLKETRTLVTVGAFLTILAVAAVAGASLGQSPGRDVTSIARRLDALGYNARHTMAWPIKVTSFDEVGVLFAELERLRERLAGELDVYQHALDRTREADETKGQFLAAVSHELRTPLNSICGFAQLLLDGASGQLTEPQAEDVRLVRTGGHQLLGLINDILDISMIESGDLSLSFSETNIESMLREIVGIHRPLVRDKDVELRVDVPKQLPIVTCDRRRVGQVVTNLISNAMKFTEAGSITIRGTYDPARESVMIRVIDTGVGIAPDELATIFEEYKQVGSLKRRAKGTGLGLAIARSIVTHHGGSLDVESVLGEGSTFELRLPINPPRTPSNIDMTEEAARAAQRARVRDSMPPEGLGL